MMRRISLALVTVGAGAQLLGLALDAWLHARDADLAAREGVFSVQNPGHALFTGGLVAVVLGACSLLLSSVTTEEGRHGVRPRLPSVLPVLALLALLGGALGFATRFGAIDGHRHDAAHDHPGEPAQHTPTQAAVTPAEGHAHGAAAQPQPALDPSRHTHGEEINVSWEQIRAADAALSTARAATEKYRDVNLARADGYIQVTQVIPGLGAHFVHPALLAAGTFDPARPPILLYDSTPDGGFELVGVSWSLPKRPGDDTPPTSPLGPLAAWHYHTDLCFRVRAGSPVVSVNSAAGCRAAGGLYVRETGWMVHAWIYRASPEGVFSHQNSAVHGPTARGSNR
jgi:hypothetical protein